MNDETQRPRQLPGALVGGALMGVPSALPILSCCCILWGGAGGALAAFLTARQASSYSGAGGAFSGLLAAGAGVVFYVLVSVPVQLFFSSFMGDMFESSQFDDVPPEAREILSSMQEPTSLGATLFSIAFMAVVLGVTSVLGGLITGAIMKKE